MPAILQIHRSVSLSLMSQNHYSGAPDRAPNANGWYNNDVTVHFTCSDALSGIPTDTCPADQVLSTEGVAVSSTAQTVTDAAGNISQPSNIVTVSIDKTAPTISAAATSSPNLAGWYKSNVTVHFTCLGRALWNSRRYLPCGRSSIHGRRCCIFHGTNSNGCCWKC